MAKLVVVHHAHHADEALYRLVIAEETDHVRVAEVENPDFIPDRPVTDENRPTIVREEPFVTHAHHQEVVWASDDPKWEGLSSGEIAAEQRRIVKKALAKRAREAKQAAAAARRATTELNGVGTEL